MEFPLQGISGKSVLVDEKYYEVLKKRPWWLDAHGYAYGHMGRKTVRMARFIMELEHGKLSRKVLIDHIDRNKLNNTIANLRFSSQSENLHNKGKKKNNTSGFIGVHYDKNRGKWMSKINIKGKSINLGRYDSIKDAAIAYNKALQARKDVRDEFKVYNEIN